MDVTLRDESIKRLSRRVLRHRWQRIVAGLACVVVFCTTYALILPAITLTRQAYCGIEEHTHSDACYEQVLVCGQDESDGHTHTDACYASEQVLVCGLEETEGHVHDDGCYQTETYLTCGLEETEGHVHTDACYERQMTCGKNEHTHTLQCYSNPDADIETEADWKATLPKLTDNWNDDVVAVALSQAGYRESLYNYEVQADDVTTNGYTRFGAWYGDVYGDWTAMFASFCTYYAEVPMPIDANLGRYMQKLADEHLWHAASEADYEPKPGSLVFLDTEDPDDVDRVGVLIKVEDDRLTLLVGDYNNKVDKLELVPNDPMIEGYAQLPEQPSEQVAEVAEPEPEGKPETAPEEPNADDSKAEEPKADDPKAEDPKSEESADETQEPGSDKDKPADETQAPASDADKPEEAGVEKPTEPESGSEDLSGDTNTLTFSGSDYTVTVGYTEKAEIPEDATLAVSEVYAGGVAYNDYLHDAKAALGIEGKRAEARFFDIKIMDGETEVKPAKPVTVTITYDVLPESADATQAEAVHFVATGAEVMNAEATAEGDGAQITFDAPSFSVYGVVYTVDFAYGEYTYSIEGASSILLSQLFAKLGIGVNVSDVTNVEFSDPSLLSIEKTGLFGAGNDWKLTSLAPFNTDEQLTVTFFDGSKLVINVTDENSDLTSMLGSVTIDGQDAQATTWTIIPGQPYTLHLNFAETTGDANKQMSTTADYLTYTLPAGITLPGDTSGNLDFTYDSGSGIVTITGSTYSYDQSTNTIRVTLSDEAKQKIAESGNTKFKIDITAYFSESTREYKFSDTITKNVDIDNNHDLSIDKTGYFSAEDGKIHYKLTIKSTGVSTDINVSDVISGTALTLDQGSIQVNGASGTVNTTYGPDGNSFTTTIDKMLNNETVTINYTASVDYGKLTDKGTVSETSNRASVIGHDDPEESVEYNFENSIDALSITKQSSAPTGEGNIKTIPYVITYNAKQSANVGGATITDKIASKSQDIMSYSGTGITVTIYDGDTVKGTITKTWADLGVDPESASSWSFKLPEADGKYKYVITYTADVDMTGQLTGTSVDNSVSEDKEGKTNGSSTGVPVGEDGISVTKTHSTVTAEKITWTVSFEVPKEGLSSAVVMDSYPTREENGTTYQDTLDSDSNIVVEGLNEGESYAIDKSNPKKLKITFSNSAGEPGLDAGSTKRTIKVTLTTKNDAEWVKAFSDWRANHTNKATVIVNGEPIITQDSAEPMTHGIQKSGEPAGTVLIDGIEYPVYKYDISIYGIEKGKEFVINDSFDVEHLALYDYWNQSSPYTGKPAPENADHNAGKLKQDYYGGTFSGTTTNQYLPFTLTNTGFSVRVSATENNTDNDKRITYYLIVKNQNALNDLMSDSIAAADDDFKVPLSNKATVGDYESEYTINYEYPAVDKKLLSVDQDTGIAKYTITINPNRVMLNNGNNMDLSDMYTNLAVDYDSIRVWYQGPTDDVLLGGDEGFDAIHSKRVTWNYVGNTGMFNVPDQTKVVIAYTARVAGEGAQHISNTASMLGFFKTVDKDVWINSSGSGSLDINWIKLLKHEGNVMNKPIGGVEFTLTDASGNPILRPATEETIANGKAGKPITFVTDNRGYGRIDLSEQDDGMSFQQGVTYYLKETKAAPGYQVDDFIYSFTIAAHPNYNKYEYRIGDIVRVRDWPQEGVLSIKKSITGAENLTDTQKKQITFTIAGPQNWDADLATEGIQNSVKLSYADFTAGEYSFETLKPGIYTVTETGYDIARYEYVNTKVDGMVSEKASHGAEIDANSRTVTFTVTQEDISNNAQYTASFVNNYTKKPVSITVKKLNEDGAVALYGAKFKVEMKDAEDNWQPLEYQLTADERALDADGCFTIDYENREKGVTVTALEDGEYRISEIVAPTGYVKTDEVFYFNVSNGSVQQTGTAAAVFSFTQAESYNADNATVAVKNKNDHTYTFTKVREGDLDAPLVGAKFTVYEYAGQMPGSKLFDVYTNDHGVFELKDYAQGGTNSQLVNGKMYYVVETGAPRGYVLPANPIRYFFYFGNYGSVDYTSTISAMDNAKLVNLGKGPQEVVIENAPETTTIKVSKSWKAITGEDVTSPDDMGEIRFRLIQMKTVTNADGTETKSESQYPDATTTYTIVKKPDGKWDTTSIDNLPTGDSTDGVTITYRYRVEELNAPDGFVVSYSDDSQGVTNGTITITNTPEPTEISVKKVWVDDGTHGGWNSIYVKLHAVKADGTEESNYTKLHAMGIVNAVELNDDNSWSYSWDKLSKDYTYYATEQQYSYEQEENIPSGYEVSYSATRDNPVESGEIKITNTNLESTDYVVLKQWYDSDGHQLNGDNCPDVQIKLLRSVGVRVGRTVTIEVSPNWNEPRTYKYVVADGSSISFELPKPNDDGVWRVENASINDLSCTVDKVESDIQINCYSNTWAFNTISNLKCTEPEAAWGGYVDYESVTLNKDNNWLYKWTDLPVKDDDGTEYKYQISEPSVPAGYEVSYENNEGMQSGVVIVKNTQASTTSVSATKQWATANGDTLTPPVGSSVVFTLFANGASTGNTITLDGEPDGNGEAEAWVATFADLPVKDDSGNAITYTVEETQGVEGYTAYTATDPDGKIVIKNVEQASYELPATGGPGTTSIVILGALLCIAALTGLIARCHEFGRRP